MATHWKKWKRKGKRLLKVQAMYLRPMQTILFWESNLRKLHTTWTDYGFTWEYQYFSTFWILLLITTRLHMILVPILYTSITHTSKMCTCSGHCMCHATSNVFFSVWVPSFQSIAKKITRKSRKSMHDCWIKQELQQSCTIRVSNNDRHLQQQRDHTRIFKTTTTWATAILKTHDNQYKQFCLPTVQHVFFILHMFKMLLLPKEPWAFLATRHLVQFWVL